jgi:phage-related protein
MNYVIEFYSEAVREEIDGLPIGFRVRFATFADRMIEHGANLGEPHTEAMGNGLFEMRLKASEGIARVFYCTLVGKRIVMLHSFVKKTPKTPPRELRLANIRMKETKNANI